MMWRTVHALKRVPMLLMVSPERWNVNPSSMRLLFDAVHRHVREQHWHWKQERRLSEPVRGAVAMYVVPAET
jgi:hypothetical protein